jgi:hypothetical protein
VPTSIQKPPAGLLSSLGIVGDGALPPALGEIVVPTIPVQAFYQARDLVPIGASTPGTAGPNTTAIQVTGVGSQVNTTFWKIVNLSAYLVHTGGVCTKAPRISVGYALNGGGNLIDLGVFQGSDVTTANEVVPVACQSALDLVLPVGAQLVGRLCNTPGATYTLAVVGNVIVLPY